MIEEDNMSTCRLLHDSKATYLGTKEREVPEHLL